MEEDGGDACGDGLVKIGNEETGSSEETEKDAVLPLPCDSIVCEEAEVWW